MSTCIPQHGQLFEPARERVCSTSLGPLIYAECRVINAHAKSCGHFPLISREKTVVELDYISKVENLGKHPDRPLAIVFGFMMSDWFAVTMGAIRAVACRG